MRLHYVLRAEILSLSVTVQNRFIRYARSYCLYHSSPIGCCAAPHGSAAFTMGLGIL